MADVWNLFDERGCWTPLFSRLLNDWQVEIVECFFFRLQGRSVYREEEDGVT